MEAEDILALQGAPEIQSDADDSDASELDSASEMSDHESEGQ